MHYAQRNSALPPAVVLPWYTQFAGQDKRIAGQTGGRMGELKNPFLVQGDPSDSKFQVQGIQLAADVPADRVAARRELLRKLDAALPASLRAGPDGGDVFRPCRHGLFAVGQRGANEAFRLDKEPAAVRSNTAPANSAKAWCSHGGWSRRASRS